MSQAVPEISVVVPVHNESGNVVSLLDEIAAALQGVTVGTVTAPGTRPGAKEPVDKLLKDLGLPLKAIFSTLGRTAARGLEASWAAHKSRYFFDKLMANQHAPSRSEAVELYDLIDVQQR